MSKQYQNIIYQVNGPLGLITLNRPKKHNALSIATLTELHDAVSQIEANEQVRVIGITGAGGKAFAAGSDLTEVENRDLKQALLPLVQGIADRLQRCSKPSIAAINGICMGGGLELALGCDLRIGTPSSRFATPEGKLGIIPGGGATQRLPRIIGRAWGMEMLLMGEEMGAQKALEVGLITRLIEADELMTELQTMAQHLANYAPFVPQFMKAMVNHGMEASLSAGLAMEKFAQGALCETEDKKEGLNAFNEKRPPVWQGK